MRDVSKQRKMTTHHSQLRDKLASKRKRGHGRRDLDTSIDVFLTIMRPHRCLNERIDNEWREVVDFGECRPNATLQHGEEL